MHRTEKGDRKDGKDGGVKVTTDILSTWNELAEDWDEHHPIDALDALETFDDSEIPATPTIDGIPEVVEYAFRRPGDWVVSGPLASWGNGRGRVFVDEESAFRWACWKYGKERVSRHFAGEGRWGFVIRAV